MLVVAGAHEEIAIKLYVTFPIKLSSTSKLILELLGLEYIGQNIPLHASLTARNAVFLKV